MKKGLLLLIVILSFSGCFSCSQHSAKEEATIEYSKVEIDLSDFSKKITGFYMGKGESVPDNFDEKRFFEILHEVYPDQAKVEFITKSFTVKAHHIENGYSVMLCDQKTSNKIMEDAASPKCGLSRVEVRYWEDRKKMPCVFETDWAQYCK